jgi:hypothetical protein
MTEPLCCSFCGKSQHEVRALVAGPSVFICNECIALCAGIVGTPHPTVIRTPLIHRLAHRLGQLRFAYWRARAYFSRP